MVLMVVRQGGWTNWMVEKDVKMRVGKQLLASKQLKWVEWQPKKESSYSFIGNVEEVRRWLWCWWWSENYCTVTEPWYNNTEYTEYWRTFFPDSIFIVLPSWQRMRCGGKGQQIDGQHDTCRQSQLDLQLLARPQYNGQSLQPLQLFCDWESWIKADFLNYQ